MEGPPLGPGGEDITWPDQVAPRGRKASSTRKIKPQTSNLTSETGARKKCGGTRCDLAARAPPRCKNECAGHRTCDLAALLPMGEDALPNCTGGAYCLRRNYAT